MQYNFSYFKGGATATKPLKDISILELFEIYESNEIELLTAEIKKAPTQEEKIILKNKQPFFTPYGTFLYRNNKNIQEYNCNIIAFDFDKLETTQQAKELLYKFTKLQCTLLATISSSQLGVKALIVIDNEMTKDNHYNNLKYNAENILTSLNLKEYSKYLDLRQFVLSQPLYISYSDFFYCNKKAIPHHIQFKEEPQIKLAEPKEKITIKQAKEPIENYIKKATEKLCNFYISHTGARHNEIARIKAIAGIIKQYNLYHLENEIKENLLSSIIQMYGKDIKTSNAEKSFFSAWETATPITNETINQIIEKNELIQFEFYKIQKISPKAIKLYITQRRAIIIPISQIKDITGNKIITPMFVIQQQKKTS